MMHLATAELDRGPVVAYCSFPIIGLRWDRSGMPSAGSATRSASTASRPPKASAEPLFAEIRRQGERREIPLLYQTVRSSRWSTCACATARSSSVTRRHCRSTLTDRGRGRARRRESAAPGAADERPRARLFVTDCEGPLTRNDNAMEVAARLRARRGRALRPPLALRRLPRRRAAQARLQRRRHAAPDRRPSCSPTG